MESLTYFLVIRITNGNRGERPLWVKHGQPGLFFELDFGQIKPSFFMTRA